MSSASSAAAREPNRLNPRAADAGDPPPANVPDRSRVVIRLPALPSEDAEPAVREPTTSVSEPAVSELTVSETTSSETSGPGSTASAEQEAALDSVPAELNASEEMTTFVIPNSPQQTNETALPDAPQGSLPAFEEAAVMAPAASKAAETAARSVPASAGLVRRNLLAAWSLVRQGHAFVMQPKIWLACVLCCFAVLLTVFLRLPSDEPQDSPQPAVKASHADQEQEAESPSETATRIVAPPADLSPAADARHFETHSSPGFAGPLGPAPEDENRSQATGEGLRVASEAKLGPRSSRYDGQTPAFERGGAAIYDVAPLDRPDEGNPEGGDLQ